MNQAVKAQWVAALRSGEYQQGTGGLHSEHRYCCLGVLCDLAAKSGIGHWESGQGWYQMFVVDALAAAHDYPPYPVLEWADLNEPNPKVQGTYIASFNDGTDGVEGCDFTHIADLIEQYL